MKVAGDELRLVVESYIGPVTPESQTLGRVVDGKPVVGCTFANYAKGDVEIMGFAEPGGITRGLIRDLAEYAFGTLQCNRVTAKVVVSNTRSARLLTRLGFRHEGTLRKADNGQDVHLFGLLPEDLKHGKLTEAPQTR